MASMDGLVTCSSMRPSSLALEAHDGAGAEKGQGASGGRRRNRRGSVVAGHGLARSVADKIKFARMQEEARTARGTPPEVKVHRGARKRGGRGRGGGGGGMLSSVVQAARVVEVEYVPMGRGDETVRRTREVSKKWMAGETFDVVAEYGAREILRAAEFHSDRIPPHLLNLEGSAKPQLTPRMSTSSSASVKNRVSSSSSSSMSPTETPRVSEALLTYLMDNKAHLNYSMSAPRPVRRSIDGDGHRWTAGDGTLKDVAREERLKRRTIAGSTCIRQAGFRRGCASRWSNDKHSAPIDSEYLDEYEDYFTELEEAEGGIESDDDNNAGMFSQCRIGEDVPFEGTLVEWMPDTWSESKRMPMSYAPPLRSTRAYEEVVRPTEVSETAAAALMAGGAMPYDLPSASRAHTASSVPRTPRDERLLVLPPRYRTMIARERDGGSLCLLNLKEKYAPGDGDIYERALAAASTRKMPGAAAVLPADVSRGPRRDWETEVLEHAMTAKAMARPDRTERRLKAWTSAWASVLSGNANGSANLDEHMEMLESVENLRAPGTTPADTMRSRASSFSGLGTRRLHTSHQSSAERIEAIEDEKEREAAIEEVAKASMAAATDVFRRMRPRTAPAQSSRGSGTASTMTSSIRRPTARRAATTMLFDHATMSDFAEAFGGKWASNPGNAPSSPSNLPCSPRMPMRRDVPACRRYVNAAGAKHADTRAMNLGLTVSRKRGSYGGTSSGAVTVR